MDRLISEQQVLKVLDNLKANFTCYDSVTLDEVYSHVKAIPTAEPYKGMTNGEVIKAVFPNTKIITQYDNSFGDRFMVFKLDNKMNQEVYLDWWNSPYSEEGSD